MSEPIVPRLRSDARIEAFLRETETRLRRLNQVLVDLAMRPSIHSGNLDLALRDITEAAARTLGVERVGVWFYTEDRTELWCANLYDRGAHRHSIGERLAVADYPEYFRALDTERTITAHDAQHDPRTSALTGVYLVPLGITSMMDAPIRRLGQITGVVCHEHVGVPRYWTTEEEHFASSIADLVVMAVDASERRQTQEILRHRLSFEKLISSISTHFIDLGPEDVDQGIVDSLGAICRFVGADRGYVALLSDDQLTATMSHEWCAEGVPPRKEKFRKVSVRDFPHMRRSLRSLDVFTVRSLDDFPAGAEFERNVYKESGNRSVVAMPMVLKKRLFGFIGLNSVRGDFEVSDETLSLLRIAGEIFVGALQRTSAQRALHSSEQRHRLLFERNLAGVYRNTLDGRMLECNESLARMLGFDSREELMKLRASDLYFDPAERTRFVEEVLRQRSISGIEVQLRRRDGRPVWLLESVHLVDGCDGEEILEGTVIDITARKEAETALRESEALYRLLAENSTDLISRTSARGRILYASPAIRSILGYEPAETVGRHILEFIHEDDHVIIRRSMVSVRRSGSATFSYRALRRDGRAVWLETTSRAVRGEGGASEIVSVSRDISERKRAEEQIEYQAYHDALTGLPNRLLFRDRLTVALAHARRAGRPLAVMFLDLDSFKVVNDTLGHSIGDELLKITADRLRDVLREEDTIARMGGDEFTVLLSNLSSSEFAAAIAQKLLESVARPMAVEGHELFITTSIGIALFPADGDTAEALLKSADNAMYRAKEAGRNTYQLCTPALNRRAVERLSTENALRRAIERGELLLHYQPQVRLDTLRVVGMEALLRWNRPDRGVMFPQTFIAIAEESRLILPLGEWVLHESCLQARAWQTKYPGLRMGVNLSPRQFQHVDLRKMIASALEESKLDPTLLEIEITETTAMLNTERTVTTLRALREMGVRIAIDDFGTGHSALNYLRSFPIDAVKIDQAFVHEIERSASDRAIVSAVIEMAHGLGLRVTAEGVETEAQVAFLRTQGCEEVQGYLFGKPAPPAAL
ncbi:MAG TPA: EAL domain-containing protein [Thermoanaerobaculia bacterium]|nr:EAL domain-containing protein [Thermoanaerobaculia bacterium]